jgi:hypothetical protein
LNGHPFKSNAHGTAIAQILDGTIGGSSQIQFHSDYVARGKALAVGAIAASVPRLTSALVRPAALVLASQIIGKVAAAGGHTNANVV